MELSEEYLCLLLDECILTGIKYTRFFFIDDILIPSRLSITQLNVKHFSFYFDSPPRFSFIWGVSFAATGLGDPNPRPRDQQRRHNVFLNTIHFILSQCCQTTMMLAKQVDF